MSRDFNAELLADVRQRNDHERGIARLNEYVRQGLEETDQNRDAIIEWLKKNVDGYLSPANVDLAIEKSGNTLSWRTAEVLKTLPDGTQQLPLDKPVPWNASKAQAKDWLARHRETHKYQRASSSFGSKF